MPVEFKDYYEILGVPRAASQDEIRRAFRKLAHKYHPDVAKDKTVAEERFKEINEANEVLSDPEKRKKYDALGANWKQGEEFRPPPDWAEQFGQQAWTEGAPGEFEFHFGGTGFSDFFENLFGMGGGVGSSRRGADEGGRFAQRGRDVEADIMVTMGEALRGSTRTVSLQRLVPCEKCGGKGRVNKRVCPECRGRRQVPRTETYQVKIPPGVYEGQLLRLGGQGEHGADGQSGDLYLRIRFTDHPDYRREEDGLYHDLDIAPWDAVLGATVSVPLLDGQANLKIPAGTRNGQRFRLRGRGLPQPGGGRGDMYVVMHIQSPDHVNERERGLWEQLRRESMSKGQG
ncbi:MAG TPA: J domain-containing protein [Verrucomicrobiae bacterium]|nr:J domain-containing protein [Verrucomicrobiae bacterium]